MRLHEWAGKIFQPRFEWLWQAIIYCRIVAGSETAFTGFKHKPLAMGSHTSRTKLADDIPEIASAHVKTRPKDTGNTQQETNGQAPQYAAKPKLIHIFGRALTPLSPKKKSSNTQKKQAEEETALDIRRRRRRELEESRPLLTEEQTGIVQRTWHILYQDLGQIGRDMFVR